MATLPPALLARLQKRGIVKNDSEEVFAESYDSTEKEKVAADSRSGAIGCPNKYNPFHVCVEFCHDHWGDGLPEHRLQESYIRKKSRMLSKYPLPEGWIEVYDNGIGRHYYWNQETDEVSWLSPRHPKAVIGVAAPKMAKINSHRERADKLRFDGFDGVNLRLRDKELDRYERGRDRDHKRRRDFTPEPEDSDSEGEDIQKLDDRDRLKRARRKGIDPMDPAAYGDADVGSWSAGLRQHDNTGADVTATGPLFQQRPYPAPGSIVKKKPEDS
ncbi:unnamed protein product [Auanema sp. JU1783]|nr:unnamed protein product [Auanema sp. JU1783]